MSLNKEARRFMDSHLVARLATADATGIPHIVPICFARLGERIYFVCDKKPKRLGPGKLKRLKNIAANPRVALLIDDYDKQWRRLAYLLVRATATVVERKSEYAAALAALRKRYPPYRRMVLDISTNPMVRLRAQGWHMWRMTKSSSNRVAQHPRAQALAGTGRQPA